MYYNDYELQALSTYRQEDLQRLARASRLTTRQPRVRMALAHALIALGNRMARDEMRPRDAARPKVALS